jgi:hypothetical protein
MKIERQSLQDPAVVGPLRERIERLTPTTAPQWGRMSVAQMLAHCAEVQEVMNGKPLTGTPWYIRLAGPLIKRAVLGRRPYRRGLRTHPQYEVADEHEFAAERDRLLDAIESAGQIDGPVDHPIFGHLSAEEAGWAGYKHLDHHLTQFGA